MIVFRSMVVATILLIIVFFSPLVITRPVDAVRTVGPTWDRTYLPVEFGTGSVEQTSNSGFIMSALSRFGGLWVMKANAAGMPEWQREYSDPSPGRVTQTSDGGFIVTGGNRVLKLDHLGSPEWSKTYDMPAEVGFVSAQQTEDGGYIALGSWTPAGSDFSRALLVKLSSAGNIEWQRAYSGSGFVEPGSVQETSDGGFAVAASFPLNNAQRAWVFKTDSLGNIVWQKAYAVPVGNSIIDDHAFWIRQLSDGGYVVVGDAIEWGVTPELPYFNRPLSSQAWVLRLDSQGDIVWQRLFGGGGFTQHAHVSEMSDGGFIVSGRFVPANLGGPLVGLSGPFLLRLDANGSLMWQKIFGGLNDLILQAQQTIDGGILAVGSMVGGAPNCCADLAWALKLDADGRIRGCPVGVPSNATLTDATAIVTNTTVPSVNTDATQTSTDVTVTTRPNVLVQDLCKIMTKTV